MIPNINKNQREIAKRKQRESMIFFQINGMHLKVRNKIVRMFAQQKLKLCF